MNLGNFTINNHWTLFLDRDGVINKRLENDYVKTIDEFEFLPGVLEALSMLKNKFYRIVVVTNQQGIGKGLYSIEDLNKIHSYMLSEVEKNGGKIDKVYFSPYLKQENHPSRKPEIGMALKAREDFPLINFHNSIMLGDTQGDMDFAQKAGMKAIQIGENEGQLEGVDARFKSVLDFTLCIVDK